MKPAPRSAPVHSEPTHAMPSARTVLPPRFPPPPPRCSPPRHYASITSVGKGPCSPVWLLCPPLLYYAVTIPAWSLPRYFPFFNKWIRFQKSQVLNGRAFKWQKINRMAAYSSKFLPTSLNWSAPYFWEWIPSQDAWALTAITYAPYLPTHPSKHPAGFWP